MHHPPSPYKHNTHPLRVVQTLSILPHWYSFSTTYAPSFQSALWMNIEHCVEVVLFFDIITALRVYSDCCCTYLSMRDAKQPQYLQQTTIKNLLKTPNPHNRQCRLWDFSIIIIRLRFFNHHYRYNYSGVCVYFGSLGFNIALAFCVSINILNWKCTQVDRCGIKDKSI